MKLKVGCRVELTSNSVPDAVVIGQVSGLGVNYLVPGVVEKISIVGLDYVFNIREAEWGFEVLAPAKLTFEPGVYVSEEHADHPETAYIFRYKQDGKWYRGLNPLPPAFAERIENGITPLVKLEVAE